MVNTNYISSIVKILENPKQIFLNTTISFAEFRVQMPQVRNNMIIHLDFWGNLAEEVTNYYQINDYIIIEGHLSIRDSSTKVSNLMTIDSKKVNLTVLKIYPFLLSYER